MLFIGKRATLSCKGRFQLLKGVWMTMWDQKLAENNLHKNGGKIFLNPL